MKLENNTAIYCKTKEEADALFEEIRNREGRWMGGTDINDNLFRFAREDGICYHIKLDNQKRPIVSYSSVDFAEMQKCNIKTIKELH